MSCGCLKKCNNCSGHLLSQMFGWLPVKSAQVHFKVVASNKTQASRLPLKNQTLGLGISQSTFLAPAGCDMKLRTVRTVGFVNRSMTTPQDGCACCSRSWKTPRLDVKISLRGGKGKRRGSWKKGWFHYIALYGLVCPKRCQIVDCGWLGAA